MGFARHDGRSRPSRSRRPGAGQAERRRNGKSPLPSPVRIRWYRTRIVAKGEGSGRLNTWTPVVALTGAGGGRQTIANDVPSGRPGRDAVEEGLHPGHGGAMSTASLCAVCSLRESSGGLAEPAAAR
jgi:hypothetical protein